MAVIFFTAVPVAAQQPIPQGAKILMKVYPNFIKGYENGYLLMSDGTKMQYDDGRKKSFEQKLDDADPEDMFAFKYDRTSWTPEYLQDAGRSRCEQLFKKMYGSSAAEVRKHLVTVPWFGEKVLFTPINGAADSLRAVARELEKHPELRSYLKSSGSFYWRKVMGANRQSAHSYGMTIDIAVAKRVDRLLVRFETVERAVFDPFGKAAFVRGLKGFNRPFRLVFERIGNRPEFGVRFGFESLAYRPAAAVAAADPSDFDGVVFPGMNAGNPGAGSEHTRSGQTGSPKKTTSRKHVVHKKSLLF